MTRAEILDEAKRCVCGEREQDYGSPEDNFETIALFWAVYLRAAYPELKTVLTIDKIKPKDVASMMGLLKLARIAAGSKPDSYVDLAGYAACAGEIDAKATEPPASDENRCVCCGKPIPEGRWLCPACEDSMDKETGTIHIKK